MGIPSIRPYFQGQSSLRAKPKQQVPQQAVRFSSATSNSYDTVAGVFQSFSNLADEYKTKMQPLTSDAEKIACFKQFFSQHQDLYSQGLSKLDDVKDPHMSQLVYDYLHEEFWTTTMFNGGEIIPAQQAGGTLSPVFNKHFNGMVDGLKSSAKLFKFFLDQGLHKPGNATHKIFKFAFDSVQDDAKNKHIQMKLIGEPVLDRPESQTTALSDHHLYIVFANVLQNAVKYTPEYGTIDVKLSTGDRPNPDADDQVMPHLSFSVTDSGIGIPTAELDKVKTGNRGSNAKKSGIPGSGYGMRRLNSLLRKNLVIESPVNPGSPNPGTRLTCHIPLKKAP